MAAAAWRHPAAQRGRLARRLREVQGDPGIFGRQRRHVPRRFQGDLLVGVGAPLSRALHRHRLRRAVRRVLADGQAARHVRAEVPRRLGAGRPAGCHRLVHGEVGARRPHRRQPIPPGAASADGLRHSVAARVAGARSRRGRCARAPAHRDARSTPFGGGAVRPHLRAVGTGCARCRIEGRADLQHLAADGRQARPRRARRAVTLVPQFLRERDDGTVRPSRYSVCGRHRGTGAPRVADPLGGRRACRRLGRPCSPDVCWRRC